MLDQPAQAEGSTGQRSIARPADGDRVTIDFTGSLKGEAFQGGEATDCSRSFSVLARCSPDFEKGVTGVSGR